jgi:ABC-type nitrate/sulfonate/bicarbonate transport system substrate-binding protein
MLTMAVPDLITNSYFPAVAAVELGFFEREGLAVELKHIFPVSKCCEMMRDGEVDLVAGSAHAALAAFPGWRGAKLLAALSQGMYWLLVARQDLDAEQGDLDAIKGLTIAAAPFVELGLRRLLAEAGIDLDRDRVTIAPVPGGVQPGESFGVAAARALAEGRIDAFWANGMGAEVAVRQGVGKVLLDIRRGDAPRKAFHYTMPALIGTDALIARDPDAAAAAIRAIVAAQRAIKADIGLTTTVADKLFPASNAAMIADVVARDLPYYSAAISEEFVRGMNQFMIDLGWLDRPVAHDRVVATQFTELWR